MEREEIQETFRYHSPDPERVKDHESIRERMTELTCDIADMLQDSREKDLFITHMQHAQMMANASIAIHGRREDTVH